MARAHFSRNTFQCIAYIFPIVKFVKFYTVYILFVQHNRHSVVLTKGVFWFFFDFLGRAWRIFSKRNSSIQPIKNKN